MTVEFRQTDDGLEAIGTHAQLGYIYHEGDTYTFACIDPDDEEQSHRFDTLEEAKAFVEQAGDELVETALWS